MPQCGMQETVEDFYCLDANELARVGVFSGQPQTINTDGLEIECAYDCGILSIHYDDYHGPVSQKIRIVKGYAFGYDRYYFLCSGCSKRRYRLLESDGFYCRHCMGLHYISQLAGGVTAKMWKRDKLMWQLENVPMRAKKMERLLDKVLPLSAEIRHEFRALEIRLGIPPFTDEQLNEVALSMNEV